MFEEDDSDASGYSDNDDDDVMTPIAEVDGDALALWTADPVAPASTADMRTISSPPVFSLASRNFRHHQQNNLTLPSQHHERSPLLHKLSPITHTFQDPAYLTVPSPEPHSQASSQQAADPRLRRNSVYQPQAQAIVRGNSSFTQTVLNATSLLLGLGILSEPLAFAYAGWIGGTILILFLSAFTCYT